MFISLIGHMLLYDLKSKLIEIGLNPFRVWLMGKLYGNKCKAFYSTRNKFYFNNYSELLLKSTSLGRPADEPAGRVLEELELKPTQPPTIVGLGLGLGLSLATRLCSHI